MLPSSLTVALFPQKVIMHLTDIVRGALCDRPCLGVVGWLVVGWLVTFVSGGYTVCRRPVVTTEY